MRWKIDTEMFETGIAIVDEDTNFIMCEVWPQEGGDKPMVEDKAAMVLANLFLNARDLFETLVGVEGKLHEALNWAERRDARDVHRILSDMLQRVSAAIEKTRGS